MQRFILKALSVYVTLRYAYIPHYARYYVRDNLFCKLYQLRYFFQDYVWKSRHKVISFQGEFDYELRYVIPYAYWHHLNGTLRKTISSKKTRELYFFSEQHEERFEQRTATRSEDMYDFPNSTHNVSYNYKKWVQVPFAAQYKNDLFTYDKPTLVIGNKYNLEWDQPPLNFIDLKTLDAIVWACKPYFQIIYNRPLNTQIVPDNSETYELGDVEWLRTRHPEVILMSDLMDEYGPAGVANNFNHLQLLVYANCRHFISVHGGTATLASYFGGVNIILSDPNHGLEHLFNDYETIIPKLADTRILHAPDRNALLKQMHQYILPAQTPQPIQAPVRPRRPVATSN